MSNQHVHQTRCAAKDLGTGILQEGLHILAKNGWLQVHPKLVQHLLHTAFMLPKNLHQIETVLLTKIQKRFNAGHCNRSLSSNSNTGCCVLCNDVGKCCTVGKSAEWSRVRMRTSADPSTAECMSGDV